jgi:hypothetical protein
MLVLCLCYVCVMRILEHCEVWMTMSVIHATILICSTVITLRPDSIQCVDNSSDHNMYGVTSVCTINAVCLHFADHLGPGVNVLGC